MLRHSQHQHLRLRAHIFALITDRTHPGVLHPPGPIVATVVLLPQEVWSDVSAAPRHATCLHQLAAVRRHVRSLRQQLAADAAERAGCRVPGGAPCHQSHHLRNQPTAHQEQDCPSLHPQTSDPQTILVLRFFL